MSRTRIGASTGCLYQLDLELTEQIAVLRELDIDGIEVAFTDGDEVQATDPAAIGDLSDAFGFVTVHAPIREGFHDGKTSIELLERLETIRDRIGADVIVVHPPKLPSLRSATHHATVAVENMQQRKGFDHDDLQAFIDGWGGPLVLDTCHAATWGDGAVEELFRAHSDRCHHVHLSAYGDQEHERMVGHPDAMEQYAPLIQGHDIVLEHRASSIAELREEITFVRDALGA